MAAAEKVLVILSTDSLYGEDEAVALVPWSSLARKNKETIEKWQKMSSETFDREINASYKNIMRDLVNKYKLEEGNIHSKFEVEKIICFDTEDVDY